MFRNIVAVVIPIVVWGLLWVTGGQVAAALMSESFQNGIPQTTGVLILFIVYSSLLSVLAGAICARIAAKAPMRLVTILAVIQFAIGVAVQGSAWNLMPVWYHTTFLAMVIPAHLLGGMIGTGLGPTRSNTFADGRAMST